MIREQTLQFGTAVSPSSSYARAWADICGGMLNVALWGTLGWQDIKQRYRRSALGPFWLTISTAIMVGALGFVYAGIFHQKLGEYLPFVAAGIILWGFISTIANESCTVFIVAEGIIKQVRLPLTVHVCRMVWRNCIILMHNALILVLLYVFFGYGFRLDLLAIPFALVIFAINSVWLGILLGVFCTRFRDIAPIVANIVQLLFFITPIMWRPEALGARKWVADYNPVFHCIELIRAPLLGQPFPALSWIIALVLAFGGMGMAFLALARFRHRIAYWI